ncbi:MAG: hypothetical protein CMF71_06315 [Magnetovibrio sp.]|nr:hypothetical protein [Magnetovibrio sp.]MBH89819.1 hypothetical protein [Magnetovibrio sp.]
MGVFFFSVTAIALGAYFLFVAFLFFFQSSLLYHPDKSAVDVASSDLGMMKPVKARSADGLELLSWYAVGQPNLPIVIYLHGNAGNIGSRGHKVRPFLDEGFGVLLVGYRGFSTNSGKPTEEGLYADALAALSFLDKTNDTERPLIIYGESLGTAVATNLASELARMGSPASGLILEAPFPSLTSVAKYHYPFVPIKWLLKDKFEQSLHIDKVKAPVFVFHGDQDKTIPISLGKNLFEKALMPKQSNWFKGAGHNDLFDFGAGKLSVSFIWQIIPPSSNVE